MVRFPFTWFSIAMVARLCVAVGQTSAPAGASSSRAPQTSSAAAGLTEVCRRRADMLRGKLSPGFAYCVDPPFVVAGDLPQQRVNVYAGQVVRHAAEAMWRRYFTKRPTDPITVLLFDTGASYRANARRLYGDEKVPYYGYYKPEYRTLLMNISTGGGTLVHELTHALIVYDFPNVPDWLNEGLASLHEQCNSEAWRRGDLVGDVNWRLPDLLKAVESKRLRPLRELILSDDFRGPQEMLNYAQARYFCMFMQHRGVLARVYGTFRDGYKEDRTGLSYVEDCLGRRRIEAIERDFLDWVRPLRYPP